MEESWRKISSFFFFPRGLSNKEKRRKKGKCVSELSMEKREAQKSKAKLQEMNLNVFLLKCLMKKRGKERAEFGLRGGLL